MLMRYKPLRGEKYKMKDGTMVTIIEPINGFTKQLKIILPSGKMTTCEPKELELPIIDTVLYEKFNQ